MATTEKKYFTPSEIINEYPELKHKHYWTPGIIGSMLKCNLLSGYYDRSRRTAVIDIASVLELINFVNNKMESQKIKP